MDQKKPSERWCGAKPLHNPWSKQWATIRPKGQAVLADYGYLNGAIIEQIQSQGMEAYVALSAQAFERRRYDLRDQKQRRENPRKNRAPLLVAMEQKLATAEARKRYLRRQASVEPVFGIIKRVLGFRQFSLRGLHKVILEWNLVCVAYNLKRLHKLFGHAKPKPSPPESPCPPLTLGARLLERCLAIFFRLC